MCELNEVNYLDGDVVWVKLGSCWWPGEVVGPEKLPPDLLPSFRKPPIAVVKFYEEDTFEYVKSFNSIYKYNCSRKTEFITKGLDMYRTKHGQMDKFPEDVIRAETAVGGDKEILTRDEFQEVKKESYAGLFGNSGKKTPGSIKKVKTRRGRLSNDVTPIQTPNKKSNYKVHILLQGSQSPRKSTESAPSPTTTRAGSEPLETSSNKEENEEPNRTPMVKRNQNVSSPGIYACHACNFNTTRLNILIMHNKSHKATSVPFPHPLTYELIPSVKKVVEPKESITASSTTTPKPIKSTQLKTEKKPKKQSQKRFAIEDCEVKSKKSKIDEEIKSSLLADWDDVDDEESHDESSAVMAGSPEVPIASESPAVPTSAELPTSLSSQDAIVVTEDNVNSTERQETSIDAKYEFCEDEDWPVEAGIGRKIPRVKNPSKRKDGNKSISIDTDDMAREVAELLNKTTLPELPVVPETFKEEENFPEPSIVKSPDKLAKDHNNENEKNKSVETQPAKIIFKTKTFFRSRHSRSQDAIGKYVAEQLNAAERMDISENETNECKTITPESIILTPIEQVKVARLAPKIQLKKMKAEAAQLLEREKNNSENSKEQLNCVISHETKIVEKTLDHTMKTQQDESTSNKKEFQIDSQNIVSNDENEILNQGKNEAINSSDNEKKITAKTAKDNECLIVKELSSNVKEPSKPYMSESTASAVDALLSVSRETDRVTKIISDDPPEDLFEDDNKEQNRTVSTNGLTVENHDQMNSMSVKSNIFIDTVKEFNDETVATIHNNIDIDRNKTEKDAMLPLLDVLKSSSSDNLQIHNDKLNNHLVQESMPSESDLQVAEALINLPVTNPIHNKVLMDSEPITMSKIQERKYAVINNIEQASNTKLIQGQNNTTSDVNLSVPETIISNSNNKGMSSRFETEQEKSENLNAAQSLVQMSESIDHTLNINDVNILKEKKLVNTNLDALQDDSITRNSALMEQNVSITTSELREESITTPKITMKEKNQSKLLKILEESSLPNSSNTKKTVTRQSPGKEKILNFEIGKQIKSKSSKQKIIIRRAASPKKILNSLTEVSTTDRIILKPSNKSSQEGSSIQTYTIQASPDISSDSNSAFQPKIRKISKPVAKLHKIKPQSSSVITSTKETKIAKDVISKDSIFDINSMPVVLSDDILTPESIEKMPIVMSDGNILTSSKTPPKLIKTKQTSITSEKVPIIANRSKADVKTLLVNPINECTKVTTPNIISKSSKLRGAKPMLLIDKTTGKQKIIMTKTESPVKEIKQPTNLTQPIKQLPPNTTKSEKFIILPTTTSPRTVRTQKIVIDPQTRKAHVIVGKGQETASNTADNKTVSAKLIPASDSNAPGNTVMIITNAQGAQSRIVLTSEHEKYLFPNKQQPNVTQLKQIVHRITPNNVPTSKHSLTQSTPLKTPTRIVQKPKSTIITSKGQLIVGSRVTTSQNIAPMPEIRPAPKRIIAAEPKNLVQTIQKHTPETLIFFQPKNGTVMQLTMGQFEHMQKTGQIFQRAIPTTTINQENVVVPRPLTISASETVASSVQKPRARKQVSETMMPVKKIKHEIAIAPAPTLVTPMPTLAPLTTNTITAPIMPTISNTSAVGSTSNIGELDNFEELLPSTAIARQPEIVTSQPAPVISPSQPQPATVSDGQLLAIPGENFGGPPGSFYLCVQDNGTLTPIDNRPLVLENNQLVPMAVLPPQPERRDILEAALANSEVFHAEPSRDDAPDFRDLNANVSVHCRVSETSTVLNQPIMTPVEVPSKGDSEPAMPSTLEDGLAVIGVTPQTVPTSLELPITVTDPRIAPKTTDPLSNNNYRSTLLPSPNTEMTFVTTEETQVSVVGPISMPLLTDEESVGKSMPILTDDITDRTVSSVESAVGSPSSVEVRESETEDGSQWPRRLLTPCSDTSETSTEIPLQPMMQFSANDLSHNS